MTVAVRLVFVLFTSSVVLLFTVLLSVLLALLSTAAFSLVLFVIA